MQQINGRKLYLLVQSALELFLRNAEVEQVPHVMVRSGESTIMSVDRNLWRLAEIALLEAERRKAQAYAMRISDSTL